MTFILNSVDIDWAQTQACEDFGFPNFQKAVLTLARLLEWTDRNSDGWAYWRKPVNASTRLQEAVKSRYNARYGMERVIDLTDRELKALETPIKAFLTREGVNYAEVFING